ncbi:MAG TPA: undecaprenyl-diphosphate phosphatase [Sphingomonadaceae bacterium]|nr:undecaprenyl-diphosphate phosphatase [Sphingomonadaceae bacterium]
MTFLQQLLVALVQGITEFLPISSSGHLILIPKLTPLPDQGPLIDVAVHVGSLLAIIIYFFRDVKGLAQGGFAAIGIGTEPQQKRLFWWVVIGTVPAIAFGIFLKLGGYWESFRITDLVAANLIVYGLLLGIADHFGKQEKSYEELTMRDAFIVGIAQALALIPGTSRSGATMTAARALGYKRVEAARFSFLLGIPAIAGAGVLAALDLADASSQLQFDALVTGGLTFLAAFATMAFLMNFLKKASMLVFVIYRVALGCALLAFL